MVALKEARFLDVKTPLEVLSEDGKKTTNSCINNAARSLGIEVMEVYTMISNGKVIFDLGDFLVIYTENAGMILTHSVFVISDVVLVRMLLIPQANIFARAYELVDPRGFGP